MDRFVFPHRGVLDVRIVEVPLHERVEHRCCAHRKIMRQILDGV